jgi:archaeal flagellin FlaB
MRIVKDLLKNEKGMTGLETAIILIAFVTVAAVFGYAVLSAGLFSAEQGKETIYAGLSEASSNLQLTGSVVAKSTDETNLNKIILAVKNTPAGNPIDLTPCDGTTTATNRCVISLASPETYLNNIKWTAEFVGGTETNNMLKAGKQCQITVDLSDLGTGNSMNDNLTANTTFTIQIKPAVGATITIQRTLPASLTKVMDLN